MKALAKNPSDRFQTAHSLREAMLAAYAAPVSATLSEETIINEVIRRTGSQEPSQPSQPSHASSSAPPSYPTRTPPSGSSLGSQPPSMTVPPPGWDAQILKQVEQQLARIVGPMAKVMVKRGASSTSDIDRLYRLLSENLTNAEDRATFLAGRKTLKGIPAREIGGTTVPEVAHPTGGTGMTMQLTPEAIEQGTKRLTTYLGPIAKVISKKAATQATSRRHFYLLLADKLTDPAERA